ncbi:hypothetical protein K440DRAFT_143947 [Wilcoxina mikolae CBS 423.85]|nr:hypothetical protein K440DRAFT_143947 [Wilcoxina mikolae CBS 423.85]
MRNPVPMLPSQSRDRPLSRRRQRLRRCRTGATTSVNGLQRYLVLFAISIAAVTTVSAASDNSTKAEILAFDLVPVTNSSESGVFEVSLGPSDGTNNQRIGLLASPYTNSDAMMEVPIAALCSVDPIGDWNVITSPHTGDVVVTGNGTSSTEDVLGGSGSIVVRWNPTTSASGTQETLSLTLRKGRGDAAKNVSEIDTNMSNDGEYPWNAAATFHNEKLKNGSDYSLMLWSKNPPRRSISGYFTLRTTPGSDNTDIPVSAADLERQKKCLEYLVSNGGYYNYSLDPDFQRGEYYMEYYKNANTTWQIYNTGVGTTTLSFDGYNASGTKSAEHFSSANMDLISHSTLGRGMFSLNMLQAARNAEIAEMNIVALNLGTEGHPGSVVLGGYDNALIDKKQRAVFPKGNDLPNAFHASMTKLSFVNGGSKTVVLDERTNADSIADVGLAYDDFGIRLSQGLINSLLPLIGNPQLDEESNLFRVHRLWSLNHPTIAHLLCAMRPEKPTFE